MVGLAFVLVFWVLSFRDPLPALSEEEFRAAQARWRDQGPANYDVQVQVSGAQPAVYRVAVRRSEPVAAYRNGRPLPQRRTWETWSVPGMFGTLASDFRHVATMEAGRADASTPRLSLSGLFHPRYGYPQRYRRLMLGQGQAGSMAQRIGNGADRTGTMVPSEVTWEVTEFTIRAAKE